MNYARAAICALLGLSCLASAFAQSRPMDVPLTAIVETIEFQDVAVDKQQLILDRIGVRVGDRLNGETRQRIGRELGRVQKGMTFTYKPGSKWGTAKLIISADC